MKKIWCCDDRLNPPECSGEPVVTTLVRFFVCVRGCGCNGHPAFPAPSIFLGGTFVHHSGALRAAGSAAAVRDFDLASRATLHPTNRSKSLLAPMVNRVLTSPYLWWFDPLPQPLPDRVIGCFESAGVLNSWP